MTTVLRIPRSELDVFAAAAVQVAAIPGLSRKERQQMLVERYKLGLTQPTMLGIGSIAKRDMSPQAVQARRERREAQIGLASNYIGLTAGAAGTATAARDYAAARRERSGKGPKPPSKNKVVVAVREHPATKKLGSLKTKHAVGVAGAALGLQALNVGGDVVANRVLGRSAKGDDVKKTDGAVYERVRKGADGEGHRLDLVEKKGEEWNGVRDAGIAGVLGGSLYASGHGAAAEVQDLRAERAGAKIKRHGDDHFKRATSLERSAKRMRRGRTAGLKIAGTSAGVAIMGHQNRPKSSVGKAAGQLVPIEKAVRRYDPEADRQRRLGLYAGTGLGGAGILGTAGAVKLRGVDPKKKVKIEVPRFKGNKAGYLLAAGGALSGAGGLAAYKRGISERNRPWN